VSEVRCLGKCRAFCKTDVVGCRASSLGYGWLFTDASSESPPACMVLARDVVSFSVVSLCVADECKGCSTPLKSGSPFDDVLCFRRIWTTADILLAIRVKLWECKVMLSRFSDLASDAGEVPRAGGSCCTTGLGILRMFGADGESHPRCHRPGNKQIKQSLHGLKDNQNNHEACLQLCCILQFLTGTKGNTGLASRP
jgi:hypothetical protein